MAHKARRRPSWKKPRSKYFRHVQKNMWNDFVDSLAKSMREEIDRQILTELVEKYKVPE